ncbi:hypothetical protein FOZ60_001530 [Perkinsus olseni]|uniref:Protease Do-like PDZ domain-containing protein n=1 Tax=Perkinsus olseni TaxID=32597 RepID=A0A7J6P2M6_PEROL|nr:hypothetical protein FOZ60_001530 [Perkinsus olseni]
MSSLNSSNPAVVPASPRKRRRENYDDGSARRGVGEEGQQQLRVPTTPRMCQTPASRLRPRLPSIGDDSECGQEDMGDQPGVNSVVKVFCTHSEPNYSAPWSSKPQISSTSTAFAFTVDGSAEERPSRQLLLTNAHSVKHAAVIQVKTRGSSAKVVCRPLCVASECDLAILEPVFEEDDARAKEFWDTLEPLKLARKLPKLGDDVTVVGYPVGGDNTSVSQGVVSRIDLQEYTAHGSAGAPRLLAIQVYRSRLSSIEGEGTENISYIIPTEIVKHFLEDFQKHGNKADPLVPVEPRYGPEYLIVAGLVFLPLTEPFLLCEYGDNFESEAPIRLCSLWSHGQRKSADDEVVILHQVLASELTVGYHDIKCLQLAKLNGVQVKNLRQLADEVARIELEASDESMMTFELVNGDVVVIPLSQERIKDETQEAIDAIMGEGVPMYNYSSWADDIKCVAGALKNYSRRVVDESLPLEQRQEALKFIVHFVGDAHQPLHAGNPRDLGGNKIDVDLGFARHQHTNLHSTWDSALLFEFQGRGRRARGEPYWTITEKAVSDELEKGGRYAGDVDDWVEDCEKYGLDVCVDKWVDETAQAACAYSYKHVNGSRVRDNDYLPMAYYNGRIEVAKEQLAKAGIRLTWLLNNVTASSTGGPTTTTAAPSGADGISSISSTALLSLLVLLLLTTVV